MKKTSIALITSGLFFSHTALANPSIENVVKLLSGGEDVQYSVMQNPAKTLHLQTTEYSLSMPGQTTYTLEFDSSEIKEVSGTLYLRDTQGNITGAVSISRDGHTQGHLYTPEGEFKLISIGDKLVIMENKIPAGLSEEAELDYMPQLNHGLNSLPARATNSISGVTAMNNSGVLRLSLYYTNDVASILSAAGINPKHYFEFYVDKTNQAYKNSDINVSVEIANIKQVNYNEYNPFISAIDFWLSEGDNFNKLKDLFGNNDFIWPGNAMDAELTESNKYGTDMDMLITSLRQGYCGIARTIGADIREKSMAVTNMFCLQTGTLPHEMGHLFGAEHNWESTGAVPIRAQYAHGYYDAEDWSFRTIMSYSCISSAKGPKECPRINYFSTPRKEFNGKYIGTADEHDNARQHNDWTPIITNLSTGADCQQFDKWQRNKAFLKGTEVVQDSMLYRANWWSYNDAPNANSSKSEWKQVWQRVTNCK
ncbi:zinc-dependent metalloprotease family protein (plasmid) [Pseudoalteromonas sp. T1lg65]|uniref:zinc-dependent metalloprotease family protein n=1 Tax=Pseudoalteromonas sp. T1lg65 TaxID=2077101 RepID=UPI003F7A0A60